MPEPRRIPLHDFHAAHGARFVDFGGWDMPVQYSSILDEHRAVRESAGLFDVSHMGEFVVSGPDAAGFLDHLLTNRISPAKVGKAVYSPMCAEDGGVIDDLIVYRTGDNCFLLCVNAGNIDEDLAWIAMQADQWSTSVLVEDQSAEHALLALQGPQAEGILRRAGFAEAARLKRFHHVAVPIGTAMMRVGRTGYTGEDGFEIYIAPEQAETLAAKLLEVGRDDGLQLCGLGARDSLRLEAGLPLYGHELSAAITPLEAGLGWAVKFQKAHFIGREALLAQRDGGLPRTLYFFRLEGRRIARAGTPIVATDGQPVGEVVSGTTSPMTGGPIGSALVARNAPADGLRVELRGHPVDLNVQQPPLHQ